MDLSGDCCLKANCSLNFLNWKFRLQFAFKQQSPGIFLQWIETSSAPWKTLKLDPIADPDKFLSDFFAKYFLNLITYSGKKNWHTHFSWLNFWSGLITIFGHIEWLGVAAIKSINSREFRGIAFFLNFALYSVNWINFEYVRSFTKKS